MTHEIALMLLPWLVVLYGVSAGLLGYVIGSLRTFAYLGYDDETWWQALQTILPNKR